MKYGIRSLMVMAILLIAGLYNGVQAQKLFFAFAHGQYASPVQTSFKNDYNYGVGAEGGVGIGFGSEDIPHRYGWLYGIQFPVERTGQYHFCSHEGRIAQIFFTG